MPVYEYRCTSCEREFEYQQRMSDPPRDICEACGSALERIISRTAFQLKGGGWYKDLYASAKPGDAGSSGGSSGSTGGSSKPDSAASPAPAASSDSGSSAPAAPAASSSGGSSGSSGGSSGSST